MRIYRQRQRRIPTPLKILMVIVIILGASFSLAWVWQTTEQSALMDSGTEPPPESSPSRNPGLAAGVSDEGASTSETSSSELASPVTREASVPDAPPSSEEPSEESSPGVVAANHPYHYALPQTELVDNSYFDDAIFIGDSITTGIPLYHVADNAAVLAFNGIHFGNINTKECIELEPDAPRVTILDAARTMAPRAKVYIMLGGNGLGHSLERFIEEYREFLGQIKEIFPDAVIYLQSITPVIEGYVNEFDPELDNEKIDAYNLEIMELARREGVYYLDVASALKDDNGNLPTEASPLDGMHFSPEYYIKWFDYLKVHAVEVPDEGKHT